MLEQREIGSSKLLRSIISSIIVRIVFRVGVETTSSSRIKPNFPFCRSRRQLEVPKIGVTQKKSWRRKEDGVRCRVHMELRTDNISRRQWLHSCFVEIDTWRFRHPIESEKKKWTLISATISLAVDFIQFSFVSNRTIVELIWWNDRPKRPEHSNRWHCPAHTHIDRMKTSCETNVIFKQFKDIICIRCFLFSLFQTRKKMHTSSACRSDDNATSHDTALVGNWKVIHLSRCDKMRRPIQWMETDSSATTLHLILWFAGEASGKWLKQISLVNQKKIK